MSHQRVKPGAVHLVIVGGGASGVLLACNLLRDCGEHLAVTMIERRSEIGRGIAYGSRRDSHLLNVRAANMSAFPEDPDHFQRWLSEHQRPAGETGAVFAPRHLYGRYLESLLEPFLGLERPQRLRIVQAECTRLHENAAGVLVSLADGSRIAADTAILATGNDGPRSLAESPCESGWSEAADLNLRTEDAVVIIGTGLTMVDHVITLAEAGHSGSILAISRRGLLPQPHRTNAPIAIDRADVPLGAGVRAFMTWLRGQVDEAVANGRDWRDVVDGLRPHTQAIWQSWSTETRRRFLRHARPWWDIHRHRLSPLAHARVSTAIGSGRLQVVAGSIAALRQEAGGVAVDYVPRGRQEIRTAVATRVIDCTGDAMNPRASANPLIADLLGAGNARSDAVGIGLDISPGLALVDRAGKPSTRVFAVGPLTRAAFWESTAIPDIRLQCARLSKAIACRLGATADLSTET